MIRQNTKTGMYEVRAFIERKTDGLFYSGIQERTNEEIWNDSGRSFPCQHSSVYLARIRPEHYTVHFITQEII
jgi:hypothetical protein